MIYEKIYLDNREDVYLEAYCSDATSLVRDALLVLPGGGYTALSDREGEPIALTFSGKGVNCFVLHYSINEKAVFPQPLIDASLAMKHIKENAEKYNINPQRVFVTGFSAGGHLACALGTMWHTVDIEPAGINKPTGMILCYPVITAKENESHGGSFKTILGTDTLTDENREIFSLENRVDENTCPAYIFHTFMDTVVPVQSSLYLALAMKQHNIPFEMHIFPTHDHGVALANYITGGDFTNCEIHTWVEEAYTWMKNLK